MTRIFVLPTQIRLLPLPMSALADARKFGKQSVLPKKKLRLLTNLTTFETPQTQSLTRSANKSFCFDRPSLLQDSQNKQKKF